MLELSLVQKEHQCLLKPKIFKELQAQLLFQNMTAFREKENAKFVIPTLM
jgi:hypothetical protein